VVFGGGEVFGSAFFFFFLPGLSLGSQKSNNIVLSPKGASGGCLVFSGASRLVLALMEAGLEGEIIS